SLTYSIASQPSHGSVTVSGNIATYVPSSGYTGNDSFTYTATDGRGTSISSGNPLDVALTAQQAHDIFPGNMDDATIPKYMVYLRQTDSSLTDLTLNGFLTKARQQSAVSYDQRFTAAAVNNYVQALAGT